MLLVIMDPENIKIDQDWSLSHIRPVLKISWKSILPFSVMLLIDTDSSDKIEKEIMDAKGSNEHPQKGPDCSTYPAAFMKSVHAFSRNMANRQTNQWIGMKTLTLPLEHNHRLSAEVE